MKGMDILGLGAATWTLLLAFGLIFAAALLAALPSRLKVDLRTRLNTITVTVSIRPLFLPNYIIIINQTRKRQALGFGHALLEWLFGLMETKLGAKHKVAGNGESRSGEAKVGKASPAGRRVSGGRARQRKQVTSGGLRVYAELIAEAGRTMNVEELSVQGKVGLDDACNTALLCGGLTAVGGMLTRPHAGRKQWDVLIIPVYHQPYFALKAKLVVRVSLLKAIKSVILAKHMLQKR